jgi:hypothetical protein
MAAKWWRSAWLWSLMFIPGMCVVEEKSELLHFTFCTMHLLSEMLGAGNVSDFGFYNVLEYLHILNEISWRGDPNLYLKIILFHIRLMHIA